MFLAAWLAAGVSEYWARGQAYWWTTIAGSVNPGSADGTNGDAAFNWPTGVALDSAGNVYLADRGNNTIRRITPVGTSWVVSTIAGSAGLSGSSDGTNNAARFNFPTGVAVDSSGSVYVADTHNERIRRITLLGTNWVVKTIAGGGAGPSPDGTNLDTSFNSPNGISVDSNGRIYVAETDGSTIRSIVLNGTNWVVSTMAGNWGHRGYADGTNTAAQLNYPSGAAPDNGGDVFVTDQGNAVIRKLAPAGTNWVVSTIAGLYANPGTADGTNSDGRFRFPGGLGVDSGGNLYIADLNNNAIRKITRAGTNWVVSTIGGVCGSVDVLYRDGIGSAARFSGPNGVAVDSRGDVYVVEVGNNLIRRGVPLPTAQPPTLTNSTLTLTWSVAVGQLLQFQYTTNLSQTDWNNSGGQFVATSSSISLSDSINSGPQRYYRVLVMP